MQEITGAKPVRDASFIAPKALSAMHSLDNANQFGLTSGGGSISSHGHPQQWPCASIAVEPTLKQVS